MYKIKRKLNKHESISPDIKPFREMFLGGISGVVLRQRGKTDLHVVFQLIAEDDGHWFSTKSGASSYWFEDYQKVLIAAHKWCQENCDPDIINDRQYGWKFKE